MLHYPKSVVRPVRESDLSSLLELAESAGKGMTNLPKCEQALQEKIATSLQSFANGNDLGHIPGYFFVLEELENHKIVGSSAIAGAGSHMMPFYHFKMSTVEYVSHDLNLKKRIKFYLWLMITRDVQKYVVCFYYHNIAYTIMDHYCLGLDFYLWLNTVNALIRLLLLKCEELLMMMARNHFGIMLLATSLICLI